MGRRHRRKHESAPYYWQTDDYNALAYQVNVDMLLALAVNRFRWVGLPDTCDPRFLETQLHRAGLATICHRDSQPDVWVSMMAAPQGEFNLYGLPTRWRAKGYDQTDFPVTPKTGELVYYSQTRLDPWGAIVQYATKLTHIQRTADVNLLHQQRPWILVASPEKRLELVNIYKQAAGYEPAILGDKSLRDLNPRSDNPNVFPLDMQTPFIGKELTEQYQNTLNQYLIFMGIPHISFEKSERLIKEETNLGNATTNIVLKNCLDARRWACERLRLLSPETFGETYVYLNDDWESYSYNYVNNAAQVAENDGEVGEGGDAGDGSQ